MKPPDVSDARSGEVAIAYQVMRDGQMDIAFVRGITGDLVSTWEQPLLVRHVFAATYPERCAGLVLFDPSPDMWHLFALVPG